MSLTSYRAAPPRDKGNIVLRALLDWPVLCRFGGDLLSHVLRRSTIGAVALNGRVRDGIGCFAHAVTTKPAKHGLSCGQDGLRGSVHTSVFPSLLRVVMWLPDLVVMSSCHRIGIKPIGGLVPVN